jgi:hypothetical protein
VSELTLPIRKLVNAFVPDASPVGWMPAAMRSAIVRFERKHGGLWVGGTLSVSEGGIAFTPNRINRAVHEHVEAVGVPAHDIRSIRREFGWFTGIVVVEHARGRFRFRCYGAKSLAARMCRIFAVPDDSA